MTKNKSSKKYLIPLIIGLFVCAIGITMLVFGIVLDDWDIKGFFLSFGPFLMFASLLTSLPIFMEMKNSTPEAKAKRIAKEQRDNQIFEEELKKYNIDPDSLKKSQKKKVCLYCGTEIEDNEKYCSSCGSKLTTKK